MSGFLSAIAGPAEAGAAARGPGVLVVDDDPAVRLLLRAGLAAHGFRVMEAATGAAAVELFREERAGIAVVLLDVRMPARDGPQTLAAPRRPPWPPSGAAGSTCYCPIR